MWKKGQIVNLNGKQFEVVEAFSSKRNIVCRVCGGANKCTPCIESNNYPENENPFSVAQCLKNIEPGCYLKEINGSKKSTESSSS